MLSDTLPTMLELYDILLEKSRRRGSLELETKEAEILLDKSGEPIDIIRRNRGDAERMIEEFMLTANEAVASLLYEKRIPCVFRVHEEPPEDKVRELLTYSKNIGLDIRGINPECVTPRELARLLSFADERGMLSSYSYKVLRSLSKAHYSEELGGHFGLAIKKYCHFTSPIRRLSDLATHRIIRRCLFEGKDVAQYKKYAARAASAATDIPIFAVEPGRYCPISARLV